MRRIFFLLVVVFYLLTAISPKKIYAINAVSASSAALSYKPVIKGVDKRALVLKKYLNKYNSPIAPYADHLILEADKYKLDWRLLTSIAGVESYFGNNIIVGTNNAWGFGIYGNNVRYFPSWNEAISIISQAIRNDYIDKLDSDSLYSIGRIYAADPSWAYKVNHFMDELDNYSKTIINQSLSISI